MPSTTKQLRVTAVRTSVPQTEGIRPPRFAGTTFLKSRRPPSPSKPERSTGQEHGTLTAHPHRVITSLREIVEPHSNVPRSKSSCSAPIRSPPISLLRYLRWPGRVLECTRAEMIFFVAFIFAAVTLFRALAGMGYVPGESDESDWRAPRPPLCPHEMTSKLTSLLRWTEQTAAMEDNTAADGWFLDAEGALDGLVRHGFSHRPFFGAVEQVRRDVKSMGPVGVPSYINQPKCTGGPIRDVSR